MIFPHMISEYTKIETIARNNTYLEEDVFVDVEMTPGGKGRGYHLIRLETADPAIVKKPAYIAIFQVAMGPHDSRIESRLYAADTEVFIHRLDFPDQRDLSSK